MALSDKQLVLLEQLTYMDEDLFDAAGVKNNFIKGQKVEAILKKFDERALNNLRNSNKVFGGKIDGKEWAGLIKAMKEDKDISNLELDNIHMKRDKVAAYAFKSPDDENDRIITFRGTIDEGEWRIDPLGMFLKETPDQKGAEEYVRKYIGSNKDLKITVTGHSNGGNKAMHVAINVRQVVRAVPMDGQGFGVPYLLAHAKEIGENLYKITAYNCSGDFVNTNLIYPDGIEVHFIKGFNLDGEFGQYHSPNVFFKTDKNGNLLKDEDGNYIFVEEERLFHARLIADIHRVILDSASDDDKFFIAKAMSEILGTAFSDNKNLTVKMKFALLIDKYYIDRDFRTGFNKMLFNIVIKYPIKKGVNFVVQKYQEINGYINEKIEDAGEFLSELYLSFQEYLNNKAEGLVKYIENTFEKMEELLSKGYENFREYIAIKTKDFQDYIKNLWKDINKSLTKGYKDINEYISDKFEVVQENLLKKYEDLQTYVSDKFQEAQVYLDNKFESVNSYIENKFEDAWGGLKHLFGDSEEAYFNKSGDSIVNVGALAKFIDFDADARMQIKNQTQAFGSVFANKYYKIGEMVIDSLLEKLKIAADEISRYLYDCLQNNRDTLLSYYGRICTHFYILSYDLRPGTGSNVRDFRVETYNMLMKTIDTMLAGMSSESSSFQFNVDRLRYQSDLKEKYVSRLMLYETESRLRRSAAEFRRVNEESKREIERVFIRVNEIDKRGSQKIRLLSDRIKNITKNINEISCGIGC